jgi:phosphatidylserine/phosphatidylglycerophosphate/cardiolipin synthase-like enzyme
MTIRGVLDPGQAHQKWAAPQTLEHDNIKLFVPQRTGAFKDLRKLHHKLMVIDNKVVVAGSFNYTQPANDYNDENLFVLGSVYDTVEKITVDQAAGQALAAFMKTEIDRMIAGSQPFTP